MKIANEYLIDAGFPFGIMKIFWNHIGRVDAQYPMPPGKSKSKNSEIHPLKWPKSWRHGTTGTLAHCWWGFRVI